MDPPTYINGARNWNTGNVTNIYNMFYNVNNTDATALNNWNVSEVTKKQEPSPAQKTNSRAGIRATLQTSRFRDIIVKIIY